MSKKSSLRWYDHILLKTLVPVVSGLAKMLMATWREVRVEGKEEAEAAIEKAGGRAVLAGWHQRILHFGAHLRGKPLIAMVSQSRDGEYASALLRSFGFDVVRGSSTRGGSKALRELTHRVIQGAWAGMVVDGPMGPPRVAKLGAVVIAKNTEAPLVGVVWGADRCWVLNSWDRFIIPKPFARVAVKYTQPIFVPLSSDGSVLETYRAQLESALKEATLWCDELFGVKWPWRKETRKS